jgi:NADPH:quinone reductase-like Zn-dependent oxidoreductase
MAYSGAYPFLSGGFAEYEYVVPNADIIKVPADLKNEEVIGVCCAFRTAVAAFERLGPLGIQSNVVVQGCTGGVIFDLLAVRAGLPN